MMVRAVKISILAFRLLWVVNLVLGIYAAFFATASAWVDTHMVIGILLVILLFFLGLPQAVVKGGSLGLTMATFLVGLGFALIGLAQVAVANVIALRTLQTLHVLLILSAIALAEICARRYTRGLTQQAA
jgi:hypothetical protein